VTVRQVVSRFCFSFVVAIVKLRVTLFLFIWGGALRHRWSHFSPSCHETVDVVFAVVTELESGGG
jgi:hypothetical protein